MKLLLGSVLFGCALLCPGAGGQGAAKADPFAGEPLVVVQSDNHYTMAADGTGTLERTIVAKVQGESTLKALSVLSLGFASKSEHVDWVYARTRHADGTVTETPIDNAIEVADPVTQQAPFYSDLKQTQLPLRDLRLGDQLEWKARMVVTKPEVPNQFWGQESFTRGAVVLADSLELDVPQSLTVNVWSPKFKPVESVTGETREYRWEYSQKKPTVGPEADAANEVEKKRVRTPDEELDEREGKLPDVAWTTFKSWEEVGAWYAGLAMPRAVPDAAVTAKVAQLTAGKTTDEAKVQAVYAYVATQIHYIGVAFGIGRYQPHSAGDVLANQYGDCKDKHTLLAAMLQVLGLHPDAVLIGEGIRFNPAVPSPAAFNHLITRVEVGGKPVWLDTTAEVAPYGMLVYATRDKDALLVPASATAKVEKTPAMPPFPMVEHMESVGSLDAEGTSDSKLTITSRGDDEIVFRSVLRQLSPAQYDLLVQRMSAGMGYGGTASHAEVSKPEDTSGPVTISYDYKRSKAGDWANLRTIPQLSPVTLPRPDEKDPPVQSLELGVPRVESSHSAMKLPDGWGVVLPEAIQQKSRWVTYDLTYKFEKGTLYAERRVEVLQQRVPVKDWKEYAKFTDAVDLGNEPYVQLLAHDTTKAHGGTANGGTKVDIADVDPALLINHATSMARAMGPDAGQMLLEGVRQKHPEQPGLWSAFGQLAEERGKLPEALDDYRKELSLYPSESQTYELLAQVQWTLKQRSEAEATLRTWIGSDPKNGRAPVKLAQYLLEDGKPADAATAAKTGLSVIPEDDPDAGQLQLLFGRAALAAADKDAARTALVSAMKSARDVELSNDAAHELADAGLELTLAEVTAAQNVSRMEEESQSWTLSNYPLDMDPRQVLLESTWETMALVQCRERNAKAAASYAQAAWLGHPTMRSGLTLGEVEVASGDRAGAMRTYQLALSAPGSEDQEKAINARIDALRAAGVPTQVRDEPAELAKLRVFSLGDEGDLEGTSEYRVLLSESKVDAVTSAGKEWVRGGEELVATVAMPGLLPKGSKARLVRHVKLNCAKKRCELTLEN